jgi:multicomponent Na+:H+ antiporter subunit E
LSGFFSGFFITVGVLSCLASVFILSRIILPADQKFNLTRVLLRLPRYLIWLIKEIIISSLSVSKKMWQLEPEISPEISWVSTNIRSDLGLTLLGNSITLTPGTLTVAVRDDGMVQVHSLTKDGLEDIRRGEMVRKVTNLTMEEK